MSGSPPEITFVVHGFLRTAASCAPLAWGLRRAGFRVINRTCFNWVRDLDALAALLRVEVDRATRGAEVHSRVHFVTHSMGGLVVRRMLEHGHPPRLGRVVSIAPPHQGAWLAARYRRWLRMPWGEYDPLHKLTPEGVARLSPAVPSGVEWGIIAGGTGGDRGVRRWLPGDNDGKVRVDEARLDGAADFLLVPYGHTRIMNRPPVVAQVVRFLREGRFERRAGLIGPGPGRAADGVGGRP